MRFVRSYKIKKIYALYFDFYYYVFKCLKMFSTTETCSMYLQEEQNLLWSMEACVSVLTARKVSTKYVTCAAHLIRFDVVLIMFYILHNLSLIVYNNCKKYRYSCITRCLLRSHFWFYFVWEVVFIQYDCYSVRSYLKIRIVIIPTNTHKNIEISIIIFMSANIMKNF